MPEAPTNAPIPAVPPVPQPPKEWSAQESSTFGTPAVIELGELYASLSEAVNFDEIETALGDGKKYKGASESGGTKSGYVHVVCRRDGKLVGYLRAWRAATEKKGIVLDIAVRRENQNAGVARAMLARLKSEDGISWNGYPNRVAPRLDRDLGTIRTIYGISLSAAFSETLKTVCGLVFNGHPKVPTFSDWVFVFLAIALASVGFRFYFASGNIRRYFLQRILALDDIPEVKKLIWIHLPALFFHAILFFFLCSLYEAMIKDGLADHRFMEFAVVFAVLLLTNAIWLAGMHMPKTSWWPEGVWITNNVLCGLLATAFVVGFASGTAPGDMTLLLFTTLMLANSLVDLGFSARSYLLGDALSGG